MGVRDEEGGAWFGGGVDRGVGGVGVGKRGV